jgi:hypothetical protein
MEVMLINMSGDLRRNSSSDGLHQNQLLHVLEGLDFTSPGPTLQTEDQVLAPHGISLAGCPARCPESLPVSFGHQLIGLEDSSFDYVIVSAIGLLDGRMGLGSPPNKDG